MNTRSGIKGSKSVKRAPAAAEESLIDWSAPDALHKHWARVHHTDREPWPDEPQLRRLAEQHAAFAAWLELQESPLTVAHALQDAWRSFHAGRFAKAIAAAVPLGPLGAVIANKAAAVESLDSRRTQPQVLKALQAAAARGEHAQRVLADHANIHYTLALVWGRYSQRISILKALAEGLGGKIRSHLERALALEPRHAEAHLALGLYHAEIVGKLGSIAAGLTYGVSRGAAAEHFQRATKLAPASPIVLMECAHGLLLLESGNEGEARALYSRAASCEPLDAMERLYVQEARGNLK